MAKDGFAISDWPGLELDSMHAIRDVTNWFFHEPNKHEPSKQSHKPSIMILSTRIYEHHTSLYDHIQALQYVL